MYLPMEILEKLEKKIAEGIKSVGDIDVELMDIELVDISSLEEKSRKEYSNNSRFSNHKSKYLKANL